MGRRRGGVNRGRQGLAQQRGFTEEAVVAKTPPDSGKRTIIGGRKAQIGPFSGMRDVARKTLRQNPRSENCATEARLPAESPTTDYRRFARIRPLFSTKGVRQCREKSNSSRFGSRMCVEGARTSGDAPPPARGAPKRPHTQKREKRTKREEAFICEGARLGSLRARCYNIRLFY